MNNRAGYPSGVLLACRLPLRVRLGFGGQEYPAPGLRHNAKGTLYSIGHNGYSWSSSVIGSTVRYLNFYDNKIVPQSTAGRADGYQVRCLLE